ncbi:Rpn family recombination-promoting nuclease/putative transposase [Burkholderia sp. MS455]|uniref:Rpn family recombination-promoting nuclease/putative transposase n=1 Tax=Burkholderia sp. MS455 TaxID=2811788 RepID=UPI00195B7ACA|nr:Rpn family recombination-promoting nuclease/putative transposase [Burkholderia sp. MS455]QRR07521.1 Rpn family recombination-promoting nuclease/putative transposase [Burkholderia sp. MS455]
MKKGKSTQAPHDAVFKQLLTQPDTARDFLELHLPAPLLACCDLASIRLESGSFVEEDLRAYYSDVLWSLKTSRGDGYVYALIEHQSSPDRHMAFRLMRYAVAAMQRHLDVGHDRQPLVIPMLFYHGQISPYPYSMCWVDEFSEPEVARELYGGAFPLVDVTAMADDEIMTHRRMAMLELLQKHIRRRDLAELVEQLAILLAAGYTGGEQLSSLLNYMMQAGDTLDPEGFMRELAQRVPQHEGILMTIAQKLEQKGRQEGRQEATVEIARAMLATGLDRAAVMRVTGLSEGEILSLTH